jgi:hypothetical protein
VPNALQHPSAQPKNSLKVKLKASFFISRRQIALAYTNSN